MPIFKTSGATLTTLQRTISRKRTALSRMIVALFIGSAALTPTAHAVNYYWDTTGDTAGFGTAGGTWAAPTPGGTTGWSTSTTGSVAIGSVTTTTSDALFFGTGASPNNLAAGSIAVSGTVNALSMNLNTSSGDITFTGGTVNLAAASTITVGTNRILYFDSTVISGATSSLTKTGAGVLRISSNNSAITGGDLFLNAGTVRLSNLSGGSGSSNIANTLGGADGFTVQLGDTSGTATAALQLSNSATLPNPIIVRTGSSGGKTIGNNGGVNPVFSGVITANDNLTVFNNGTGTVTVNNVNNVIANTKIITFNNTNTGTLANSAIWSGMGGVTYTGNNTGNTTTNNQSTYSGTTTLGTQTSTGAIVPQASSLGAPNAPTSGPFGTGTLSIGNTRTRSQTAGPVTIHNPITFAGNPTFTTIAGEQNYIFTGNADLGATRTLTTEVGSTDVTKYVEFSGIISGTGFGITKAGAGNLLLSGANTYTGDTTVNAGTLSLSGSLTGSNVVVSGTGGISQSATGVIAGTATLTHSSSGSSILAGTNTYNGATSITGGTLNLTGAGAINSSSGIAVNGLGTKLLQASSVAVTPSVTLTQGTVTGSGTINTVDVGAGTGGVISNNDGVAGAVLTIGTLTFNGGSTVNTFSSSSAAPIVTTSLSSNVAGTVTINPTSTSWVNGTTYNLISYGGGAIGGAGFSQFTLGTLTPVLSGRQTPTFGNSGTAITLAISGDNPKWTGLDNGNWQVGTTGANENWKLVTAGTTTTFLATDDVLFDDSATGTTTIDINAANVAPSFTTFNNSTTAYTLGSTGGFGISSGTLTKSGSGTLTITNANTYSSTTTLNSGILNANSSAAIGDGSATNTLIFNGGTLQAGGVITSPATRGVTMTGAGTIDNNGSNTVSIAGVITGTGVLTKSGSGTLILTGNNTFSGGITINASSGSVQATKNADPTAINALGTGSISIGAGSTLQVDIAKITAATDTIANTLTGSGLLKVQFAAGTTARNVTMPNVLGFNGTIQLSNLGATGDKWAASGVGTVPGSLVIDSGSTIFVSSATPISFTGGVTLNGAGNTENRGAIRLAGATTKFAGNINLASSSTISMENVAAEMTSNISSSVVGTQTLTLGAPTGSAGGILSGIISDGTGTIAVTQAAAGTYTLSGVNTYTGVTSVNAGSLSISSDANLGTAPGTATPGHLSLNGGTLLTTAAMTLNANRGVAVGASNGTINVNTGDLATGQLTYNGIVAGAGTLIKTGIGTLILGGNNTNSGFNLGNGTANASSTGTATASSGGYVVVNHNNALGTGPISSRGAQLHAGTTGIVIPNVINVGVDTIGGGLRMGGTNDFTLSGAINIGGSNRTVANYSTGTPITITLNGTIDLTATTILAGSSAMSFESANVPNNGAKFIINGAILGDPVKGGIATNNTFDGCELYLNNVGSTFDFLALNEGTVFVPQFGNKADVTGYLGTADSITFGTGGATLQHTGAAETSDKDFLLNAAGAINSSGSGITLSGVISGAGGLTKTGASTLTLATDNSYLGGTTISTGTLQVGNGGATGSLGSGAVINNGVLVVNRTGTLTTGAISGTGTTTVTAAGASLTANHVRQSTLNIGAGNTVTVATNGGNSGTSTLTNLNINATGKLDLANNDLVVDNGNLATLTAQLASGLDINGSYGNGPGITSSAFASNPNFNTVLGIAANVELGYTSFSGQTVDANDILIKYTYYGDADLSGSVDTSTDFDLYITGLTSGGSLGGWLFGDFDYNGTVDSSTDFDLYITGLTTQGGPLLTTGGGGNLVQAVPEPSTLVLAGMGVLGFVGAQLRHRRVAGKK